MDINSKKTIHRNTDTRHLLRRFCAGATAVRTTPINRWMLAIYLLTAVLLCHFSGAIFGMPDYVPFSSAANGLMRLLLLVCSLLGLLGLVVFLGTPSGSKSTREALQKVGLVNHAGEAPVLIVKHTAKDNSRLTILEFDPCGLSLDEWEKKRESIETALNVTIAKIEWAKGHEIIRLVTVSALNDFPTLLIWRDEYLSTTNFVLTLGESLLGPVTVNLAHIPHILLGGSTGSGKSVLLKLLLMQALHKGAEVAIADFKGGVDFPLIWHHKCWICTTEQEALKELTYLVNELNRRKDLLSASGCKNIDDYNKRGVEHLKRRVFACDEVAEMLDKTGRSKEDKELLAKIENKIATIARQGRAFGIHLILSTQRPDATIIPGQIRSNIDFRVCGRADNVLSQIILDNTTAAEQIPKDAQGRFITSDGTVFQAYLFNEEQL